jgi:hypothetical protein
LPPARAIVGAFPKFLCPKLLPLCTIPLTMRIPHLLIAVLILSPILSCGSVNRRQTPQQKAAGMNPRQPLMGSQYLKTRESR